MNITRSAIYSAREILNQLFDLGVNTVSIGSMLSEHGDALITATGGEIYMGEFI